MTKTRLSPDDWIRAGLRALATLGPQALRAEALARDLKSTKGSFYWHFKDVPDFHAALLTYWRSRVATDAVGDQSDRPPAAVRLRELGRVARQSAPEELGGRRLEPAIRAWSQTNPGAADAVRHVDRIRLDYVADLLGEIGLTNPDFARLIYAAHLGLDDLASRDGIDGSRALGTLIDLVLSLE